MENNKKMDIWDKFKQIYLQFSKRYNDNMEKPDVSEQIKEIYDFIDDEFKQNNLIINLSDTDSSRWINS